MKQLFRQIAACPACRSDLDWQPDQVRCTSAACGRTFRMVGNVAVLDLREEAGAIGSLDSPVDQRSALRRLASRALSSGRTTYKAREGRDRQQRFVNALGPGAVVLNVGSGTDDYGPRVVNLDIGPFSNVDVVGRSEWLPVRTRSVDGVITTGVLEHVGDLAATMREIDRVLRPGGEIFHEVPFIQGFHGTIDYRRFTYQGARQLASEGYAIVDQGVALGPSSAVVWALSEWLGMLLSFGSSRAYPVLQRIFARLISPLRFFDEVLEGHAHANKLACSLFVHARKIDSVTEEAPSA